VAQVLQAILAAPLPVPSALVPGVPAAFDAWWARAAARDPSARFQSAREMADALGNVALATPGPDAAVASRQPRGTVEQDTLTASQVAELELGLPASVPEASPPRASAKALPQTLSGQSRAVQPPRTSRRGAIMLMATVAGAAGVIALLAVRDGDPEVTAASSSFAPPEAVSGPTETAAPVEVKPAPEAPPTASASAEARAAPTTRARVSPVPVGKEPRANSGPPGRGGAATPPTVKQLEPGY